MKRHSQKFLSRDRLPNMLGCGWWLHRLQVLALVSVVVVVVVLVLALGWVVLLVLL
jgi:hypothetical protein